LKARLKRIKRIGADPFYPLNPCSLKIHNSITFDLSYQKMNLTDTHIHLYAEEFDADRSQLIDEARKAGVERFFLPNIDEQSVSGVFELTKAFPGVCFPMLGLHPCYVNETYKEQLAAIRKHINEHSKEIIAIGEIGLDFYWDLTFKSQQEFAFREQALLAAEMKLPISIHSRNSTGELINLLREINHPDLKGVFHCFSGDINQADEVMNMGFYLGIGGVVTFKNSGLEKIVSEVPLEFIVLETDGPYLAPTPFRGKRNNPSYLKLIAERVAEIKNLSLEEIAAATTKNAVELFNLGKKN